MDGADADGGVGSSEGHLTGADGSALSETSKTVPILVGMLLVLFGALVIVSYL